MATSIQDLEAFFQKNLQEQMEMTKIQAEAAKEQSKIKAMGQFAKDVARDSALR